MFKVGDIVRGTVNSFQKFADDDLKAAIIVNIDEYDADLYILHHARYNQLNGTVKRIDIGNIEKIGFYEKDVDSIIPLICPAEGSFVAYSKGYDENEKEYLITLEVPADAFRTSNYAPNSKRCRCSKAKVLNISLIQNTTDIFPNVTNSIALKQKEFTIINRDKTKTNAYYNKLTFTTNETVEDNNCIKNRWVTQTGIYFYMTPKDAILS